MVGSSRLFASHCLYFIHRRDACDGTNLGKDPCNPFLRLEIVVREDAFHLCILSGHVVEEHVFDYIHTVYFPQS